MGMLEDFGRSTAGKVTIGVVFVVAALICVLRLHSLFGTNAAAATANERIFICSETHRAFNVNLESLIGQTPPVMSPYSGKKTGYPAELCYWTADGKPKSVPTPVLMNSYIGKPEPTFCPDCGRLVVFRNPGAGEGMTPPPTREEWMQRHGRQIAP